MTEHESHSRRQSGFMPSTFSVDNLVDDGKALQDRRSSPAALSGPGTTRQNRRLQLRKNGFRGRTVTSRNVTPKHATQDVQSSMSLDDAFDEEVPDTGSQRQTSSLRRRPTILQEVSNSSLRRKNGGKPRSENMISIFQDENRDASLCETRTNDLAWEAQSSPACLPIDAPDLTKSRKRHQRAPSDKRDSINDETTKYIEHLESELASAQTQLSSMTSPTVAHARSLKMRALNVETRQLHDEVAQWETRFHERVQEETEQRLKIETGLKSKIRLLETDTEGYAQKVKDMQHQLDQTKKSLEVAEAANVELEKRLETFANLLVTSPIKEEFPLNSPFNPRKSHVRQKSVLPRFPTTGSLMAPASVPVFTAPALSMEQPHNEGGTIPRAMSSFVFPTDSSDHFVEQPSRRGSQLLEEPFVGASKRDSMTSTSSKSSISFSDIMAAGEACPSTGKIRPSRRMRRFHGGSVVPKPLLLSSTQLPPMQIPATAPPYEPTDSPESFPFPEVPIRRNSHQQFSPLLGRRRAMTSADGLTLADLQALHAPLSSSPPQVSPSEESLAKLPSPDSALTESTPRDFSSLGSAVGRNLFEELRRAKTSETPDSSKMGGIPTETPGSADAEVKLDVHSSGLSLARLSPSDARRQRLLHKRSVSEQTTLPISPAFPSLQSLIHATSPHHRSSCPDHDQTLTVFADLWRSPFSVARRCLSRAHSAMLLSTGVNKLQWWLVNFLLGPMLTRRVMRTVSSPGPRRYSPSSLLFSCFDDNVVSSLHRRKTRRSLRSSHGHEDVAVASSGPARSKSRIECSCGTGCRSHTHKHSPWLWLKFSFTLAFAIGAAIKDGPGSLLTPLVGVGAGSRASRCACGCSSKSTSTSPTMKEA